MELVDARNELSELLARQVDEICLPIGYFSTHLLESLKSENYSEIYSSIPGDYSDEVFGMRRRNLVQSSSPYQVGLVLKGGNSFLTGRYLNMHFV